MLLQSPIPMELRILATADLHLGMPFGSYPELQSRLAEARFAALQRLVALGNEGECRLLLVAGDLFHRLNPPQRDIQRAAELLSEFRGEAVAVLPGNHDYYAGGAGSLWRSFREKAGGQVLLLAEPHPYELAAFGLPVTLYPGPCTSRHSGQHALGWLAAGAKREADTLAIGVAHGSLQGLSPDAQGEYYPMRRSELETYGMDFWVLGHTHRPPADADPFLFLPGTPEPDGFDCTHEGSVLLLRAEGGRVSAERLVTGSFRFRAQALELGGQEPESALAAFRGSLHERTLLRLVLRGSLDAEALARVRAQEDLLRQAVAWLETDETELRERITRERVDAEFARGSFSWLLLHRLLEAGQEEALEQAYALIREVLA